MARYEKFAEQIRHEIDQLAQSKGLDSQDVAIIGKIVNLAIRANPRPVQSTVRKNIVAKAVQSYCNVTMIEKEVKNWKGEMDKIKCISITPRPTPGSTVNAVHCYEEGDSE